MLSDERKIVEHNFLISEDPYPFTVKRTIDIVMNTREGMSRTDLSDRECLVMSHRRSPTTILDEYIWILSLLREHVFVDFVKKSTFRGKLGPRSRRPSWSRIMQTLNRTL